jgi:hypothetical protein
MLRMLVSMLAWPPCADSLQSPKYVLTEIPSFAIWDRNKIVLAISAIIWLINLGFQLAGKLTSTIPL